MDSFRGKRALVTGAASGIGRAIAIALAKEGANLWLLDIDEAGLSGTAGAVASCQVTVDTSICDLADPVQIAASVRALLSTRGNLNILINSAGIVHYGSMHLTPVRDWNRVMAVNLLAPIRLIQEFFPTLAIQDEAHILNVCSLFGLVPYRKIAAYQTSKFGLVGYTQALRAEYARPGFGVTCLCPGFVRTPMLDKLVQPGIGDRRKAPPSWLSTTPERVAERALWAMRRSKGMVVVTPMASALWWLDRFSPAFLDWFNHEGWRARGKVPVGELRMLQERDIQEPMPPA